MNRAAIFIILLSLFFQRITGYAGTLPAGNGQKISTNGLSAFGDRAIIDLPVQLDRLKQRINSSVRKEADLRMTSRSSRRTVNPGDKITYRITLANRGQTEARNIKVSSLLAPQVELLSVDRDASISGSGVVWELSKLKPGEQRVMVIDVRIKNRIRLPQNIFNLSFIQSQNGKTSEGGSGSLLINPLKIPATISI